MGSDWNDNDHLDVEIEKTGGSKLYITYSSASAVKAIGIWRTEVDEGNSFRGYR
jgi:hypothetical protein